MSTARLGTYLWRFQLRDFLLRRAAVPAAAAIGMGWLLLASDASTVDWATPRGAEWSRGFFATYATLFMHAAAFLGVARLVADDCSNGYYRFLFSKPLSVARFYAQQWVLHGVGLVAIAGVIVAWYGYVTAPAPTPLAGAVMMMGLTWVLVGGVGFAFTAVTDYDAPVLIGCFVVSEVVQLMGAVRASPPWLRAAAPFALPLVDLTAVREALFAGDAPPWSRAAHVAAYGVAGFIAGLIVLRRAAVAR